MWMFGGVVVGPGLIARVNKGYPKVSHSKNF
jgi:UDP-N-acetylglucosamine:LPS N-acetylglucosamine transferase